jgi:hypothetical protein
MEFDDDWNVKRVKMSKSTVWYLVIVIIAEDQDWRRELVSSGQVLESSNPPKPQCIPIICPLYWPMYGEVPFSALGGAGLLFELQGPIDARKLHVGPKQNPEPATQP